MKDNDKTFTDKVINEIMWKGKITTMRGKECGKDFVYMERRKVSVKRKKDSCCKY